MIVDLRKNKEKATTSLPKINRNGLREPAVEVIDDKSGYRYRQGFITRVFECKNCRVKIVSPALDANIFYHKASPRMICPSCGKSREEMKNESKNS
jgi:primosomal protein N'